MTKCHITSLALWLAAVPAARAGMTAYDLNDVVRLRLEDISFFAVLLLVCAVGIKLLWNHLAKGLPKLPPITFVRSLCLTALLSLLMLLVLSMISGARLNPSSPMAIDEHTRLKTCTCSILKNRRAANWPP